MLRRLENVRVNTKLRKVGRWDKDQKQRIEVTYWWGSSFSNKRVVRSVAGFSYDARIQSTIPVTIFRDSGRTYWRYKERYYWENEELAHEQVKALLDARELNKQKQIKRAETVVASHPSDRVVKGRDPIADDVKIFVWQRDGGQCVKCGSNENLEFDHIIPVSMGGANTARNLQLLCEPCNREKSGHL